MAYKTLEECLIDLEKHGQLIRIKEEVDPYLEMAAIHLRVYEMKGPALLFEKIKGTKYRAASNIFGTLERSKFIFKNTLPIIQQLIHLKNNPFEIIRAPVKNFNAGIAAITSLPQKISSSHINSFEEINITDLPLIHHWEKDGGAFVTLPQVYTEDVDVPGIANSNLGMYRIQLTGNDYILDKEIGLHYQLHRGIGVHQTKANNKNMPLKVSCFVGGPPAHALAAVMPLPEGMSELNFAGVLAGRRFRYFYQEGFCFSADADFVITGEVYPNENKPEGPFGDHFGYYSLTHDFPLMKVHKVYAKKKGIWAFTVVGRPPQEDTNFGNLIHEITGDVITKEIPGLKELNAVDAAGVHPLLLAIGSERYTPYLPEKKPSEILTIANRILGTGQLSLAKFLFITADDSDKISTKNIPVFFKYFFERIDFKRDVHFYTNTTIDTLDYSGTALNTGSKVLLAAYGEKRRELCETIPDKIKNLDNVSIIFPGIIAVKLNEFKSYEFVKGEIKMLNKIFEEFSEEAKQIAMIIICDEPAFVASSVNNFLWVSFTRSNPSHDIHGMNEYVENKHWCCNALILDARIKPHHAPVLKKNISAAERINHLFKEGGSLFNIKA